MLVTLLAEEAVLLCGRGDFCSVGRGSTGLINSKHSQKALVWTGKGMVRPSAKGVCR